MTARMNSDISKFSVIVDLYTGRNHSSFIAQELCESRGGRPGLLRPNEPSSFRGRKDLLNRASALVTTCP